MKASYISIGILLLAGIAAGCDNIGEDDRYIKVEKPTVDNPKNLLIMEFTGNNCSNCPKGAETVEAIKEEESPGRIISVGLHPKDVQFTTPTYALYPKPHMQDFCTEEATVLYKYYEPGAFPAAIFNGLKSSMSTDYTYWATNASNALVVPANMAIEGSCTYDESTRNLTVDYQISFGKIVNNKLNVTVWLVENNILGTQIMGDGDRNWLYVHNHVLRASLNGNWGEYIGDSFDSESKVERSASMTLKEEWVAENCDVVVYVYRDDNKEVEQAISIKVK